MTSRDDLVDTLASYLPDLVLRALAGSSREISCPVGETQIGAVLIADLTGFTNLTEALSQQGVSGAESLTRILNEYFGRVIEVIGDYGGDIVRFAGDAILAVWPADEAASMDSRVTIAASCAICLQETLHGYRSNEGIELAIKIGIGAGEFSVMHLGGEFDRREFLITGLAFIQSFAALDQARAGQVVTSLQAWTSLQHEFVGDHLQMGAVLVRSPTSQIVPPKRDAPPSIRDDWKRQLREEDVRAYVPATVCARLAERHDDWLGELRSVTVLFINLPELNYAMPLERAQTVMRYLQQELYRYEGSINKLNVDDKGTSLLAAMGLPPLSHEDDGKRAVNAAIAMRRRLQELGLRSSTGIATGRVFCGSIGNARRREYTIMGDTVNLAARLMQTSLGDIHCDEATCRATGSYVEFQRLADINIKGKAQPVPVFRPMRPQGPVRRTKTALIGRTGERDVLIQAVESLVAQHVQPDSTAVAAPRVIVLEGTAGIGKSRLVDELLTSAEELGVMCCHGGGDSIEMTTLYYAWRPIIRQLLNVDTLDKATPLTPESLAAHLQRHTDLHSLVPLLGAVLGIEIPDNEYTRQLTGRVRGENTRQLLHQLLSRSAKLQPTVFVLEDVHWLDSASWALVSQVVRDDTPLVVVLATRPFTENPPIALQEAMQAPRVALLRLAPLNAQETRDLICSHLGVDAVADSLLDLVHRKADGNPLFCHQLADVIDDALDKSQQDRARCLTQGDLMLERIEIPNTLHGAITSRIDRLEPSTQLALKVASVIGRHFSFRALQNNFPIAQGRLRIRDYLRSGLQANLIEVEIPEPSVTYVFEHVFTRDVAYQMLLFDQRRQLHHAVAEWLEQTGSDEGMASAEVLAHHWRHAGRPDKAIEYLDRAGNAALRNGAYAEAAEFLRDALSLAESIEPSLPTDRLARWQRQLGESLLGLGQLANGKARLESSLELLQYPSPTTHSRLLLNLLGQLATQLQRRMRAALRPINSLARTGDSSVSREAVRAYERLAETYYLMNDRERLLHALLVTVNLAERIGPSPELARAYANNCFAAGLAGIHPLARSYSRDAQRIAAAAQDLSATAWVQQACGIYQLGLGQLDTALDCFSKAATVYRQIGDWTHWGETVAAAAQAQYHRGSVAIGTAQWQELHDVSIHRGDVLQQAWALNGLSESELRRGTPGHAQRALRFLEQARTLYQANVDRISLFGSIGLTAWAHLRQADDAAARQAADAGSQLATELGAPTGYYSLNGYLPIAHTYLTLYERTGGRDRTLAVLTRQACRRLDRYARTFPLGRAYADWQKGIAKWLAGNQTLAIRVWRRALASAEQRNLPHAAALVHFEIGRRVAKQPAAHVHAADHLRQARQLFLQLDAQYERAQTEQLLSQIGNLFADEA